jgi:hypothetical protein
MDVANQFQQIRAFLAPYGFVTEPFNESVSISIIFKERPLFNARADDMMQCSGSVYARFP